MRYENTSDAERRHHHPGGHGHGPGFGGFGRGGGHRRGRGRGFGRPGGWQQADLPPTDDLTAWLTGRLPEDWFTGAPQVTVDREEITVIGELLAPAIELAERGVPLGRALNSRGLAKYPTSVRLYAPDGKGINFGIPVTGFDKAVAALKK